MATELIHIGFGNYVSANQMVGLASPSAAPIKKLIYAGRTKRLTIDMTSGHRTRAVLFMENGSVVLAAITPETINLRAAGRPGEEQGER